MSDPFSTPPPPPPSNSSGSLGTGVVPCGNGVRFGAFLLEGLLFVVTCGIGWLIWDIVLWQKSTSPAKKMLNLKIVDINTGAPASMAQMLLREVLGKMILSSVTSGLTTLVSAILILVVPGHQGVWDFIAKTTVVRES